jgi:hypothetical protein
MNCSSARAKAPYPLLSTNLTRALQPGGAHADQSTNASSMVPTQMDGVKKSGRYVSSWPPQIT